MLVMIALPVFACGGKTADPVAETSQLLRISNVQSDADRSPLEGQSVTIEAIVSGDFQDNDPLIEDNLGGFYAQDEVPDGDNNTSDGIFVYDAEIDGPDVTVGDRVRVTGQVAEFFGETQIKAAKVEIIGGGEARAVDVLLPAAATIVDDAGNHLADLEKYEGMLLHFPQALAVTDLRSLERFGQIGLAEGGRLFQFSNAQQPDIDAYEDYRAKLSARRIILDDGQRVASPKSIKHLESVAGRSLRGGDTIKGLTGNLRFSRGSGGDGAAGWRIMPTKGAVFSDTNPRPAAPPRLGAVRIASFNVLNFFARVDNGQPICGSGARHGCRGADTNLEQQRQLSKIVSALDAMQADIVGLIELENDARGAISMIVDALNQRAGNGDFRFVDTGSIGDDAIKTGFIFNASTIELHGSHQLLDDSIDQRFDQTRHRPALAQTFVVKGSGARFSVVVNHFKSKGSACDDNGDINVRDGQGNCNLTREQAAIALAEWLASDPVNSNDTDYLIIGDLNAYMNEDPIIALQQRGFVNLLRDHARPYSFVFDGQAGALDHALASESFAVQIDRAIEWHINADEPPMLDYNLENDRPANFFDKDSPYRASDHDPIIVDVTPSTN